MAHAKPDAATRAPHATHGSAKVNGEPRGGRAVGLKLRWAGTDADFRSYGYVEIRSHRAEGVLDPHAIAKPHVDCPHTPGAGRTSYCMVSQESGARVRVCNKKRPGKDEDR